MRQSRKIRIYKNKGHKAEKFLYLNLAYPESYSIAIIKNMASLSKSLIPQQAMLLLYMLYIPNRRFETAKASI